MNVSLPLAVAAPFRLDLTAWVLRRAPQNGIDCWDGRQWRRSFDLGDATVTIAVDQSGTVDAPHLTLHCSGTKHLCPTLLQDVVAGVRSLLGIDADLSGFDRVARADAQLAALAAHYRGLRPPRFADLFEALANAVACQRVSLASGLSLLGKTARYLAPSHHADDQPPPFPRAQTALVAGQSVLRGLGWSQRKAEYLLGCTRAAYSGELNLAELERASDSAVLQRLGTLRGIKRWSAQYVALRGLGRLAVLPVDDVGAQRHLAAWLGIPRLDAATMERLAARWSPAAGMVYFVLLLRRLERQRLITAAPQVES